MRLIARQGHADRLVLRLTVGSDEVAGGNGGRVRLIALLQYCRSEINQQQKEHISRTVAPSLTAGPWSWEALTGYSVRMWGMTISHEDRVVQTCGTTISSWHWFNFLKSSLCEERMEAEDSSARWACSRVPTMQLL